MKLNLFNTVNNKERGRGQRSVVWLKRSQPCLHHLHVLSTTFSWRPLSSFSLWIILLPFDSRCFLFGQAFSFFVAFSYAWLLCNRCFLVIWADNLGGTFVSAFCDVFFAWVFRLQLHGSKGGQQLWRRCFPETERLWFCIHSLTGPVVHERSGQAVYELSGSSGSRA